MTAVQDAEQRTAAARRRRKSATESNAPTAAAEDSPPAPIDLRDPSLYINRELSSIDFIGRVLEESFDERNPLLERIKFLAICSSVLDEFYETRVAELYSQAITEQVAEAGRDAMTAHEQLNAIHRLVQEQSALKRRHLREVLIPQLAQEGIYILNHHKLPTAAQQYLRTFFEKEVFPLLTPLAIDAGHPFPHISSLSLNLLVLIRDGALLRYARVKIPTFLARLIPLPPETYAGKWSAGQHPPQHVFAWLEQVIAENIGALFPGKTIVGTYFFRVTRSADLALREAESENLLTTIEESLEQRFFGFVVRLEISSLMPQETRAWLIGQMAFNPQEVNVTDGPLGLRSLMELGRIDRPDLKDPPFAPGLPTGWPRDGNKVLDLIRNGDVLIHHPFDSFQPVVDFVRSGVEQHVLGIKQTLYRVGANSPIVDALLESRDDDTQVAVLVELKARGDEESNIGWARALEQAGVHVAYGLVGLKTHCKLALIVRRETDGLRRYAHLGTGNYNAQTARLYTDLGLFTADPDICADVSEVFNVLTGYSEQREFRKLLVAPHNLRRQLVELIDREATHGEQGHIVLKMNALVDAEMVEVLYRAARAGVTIDLIVRGACCLRPGVPGVSDTIRVISIVGRFLEHSRIFYFANGEHGPAQGTDSLYLGSADMMPRNLNRRVEVLFPVESPEHKAYLRDSLLPLLLSDNVKARELGRDGLYRRRAPAPDEPAVNAQEVLLATATALARP
ncbi:MAG: polyphosphate kinase 1 [Thermomicrobiales bacterium]